MSRNLPVKKFTRKKLLVLFVSFVVAVNMGIAAYFYYSKDLTDWQKNQPMDLRSEKGLTRAKVYIDSGIVGGLSFGLCAGLILFIDKIRNSKK
jgi:hypothetical protein